MVADWLDTAGLLAGMLGFLALARGSAVSRAGAARIAAPRLSGETSGEELGLPAARDRLRQARSARIGSAVFAAGVLLQILGRWV